MVFILSLVLSGLLAVGRVFAAPVAEKRSIDTSLLNTFNLMEQYAAAAYCANNHNSTGDKVTCVSGNCPLAQSANTKTVLEFEFEKDNPTSEATGNVVVDNTNKLIIVAFRGSHSQQDWATNLNLKPISTNLCSGCTVHKGFWNSWLKSRSTVTATVKKALREHPQYTIATTGHSLGGALSTLAATDLRNSGLSVAMYSFGAPRIGNLALSKYITHQPGGNYRVTHLNDIVPQVPATWMGFAHISPEYYIRKKTNARVEAGDIDVYEGHENWFGNGVFVGNGGWVFTNIEAHRWYFNKVTQCGKATDMLSTNVDANVDMEGTF